jgi:predicted metalloprotease
MELGDQRESSNVEDRRGMSVGGVGGGIGLGTVAIALVVYFLGGDPSAVLNMAQDVSSVQQQRAPQQQGRVGTPTDEMGRFVSRVLGSTEDVWSEYFRANGREYRNPKLVLYTQATRSACGLGQAAMGPFYCPNDEQLYVDLSFYNDLRTRFHAPGEFAEAYVIAHEVGHHVQNLLGTMQKLQQMQGRASKAEFNRASVRIELQADCYAGIWAHYANAKGQLDTGEFQQGLTAASAIGDDRLQRQAQGYVVPESFTHGSSEQRVRWFKRGMDSGRLKDCDTLSAQSL